LERHEGHAFQLPPLNHSHYSLTSSVEMIYKSETLIFVLFLRKRLKPVTTNPFEKALSKSTNITNGFLSLRVFDSVLSLAKALVCSHSCGFSSLLYVHYFQV